MHVRVGILAVSHSPALAQGARDLALEMIPADPPPITLAAGLPDGSFGTDATAVAEGITGLLEQVADAADGGVVVITDLGSAVLSAEMALEFLPEDSPVRIVPAPFVEGLLAAVVAAGGGEDLESVAARAASALQPKQEQLATHEDVALAEGTALGADTAESSAAAGARSAAGSRAPDTSGPPSREREVELRNAHGLHARPAAQVASLATDFPAVIEVIIPGRAPASARSPLALAGLGTRGGDRVLVRATGEDAEAALDAVASLVGSGFGEEMVTPPPDAPPAGSRETASAALPVPRGQARGVSPGRVVGVVARMAEPPTSPDRTARIAPAARDAEVSRMQDAAHAVATELQGRAAQAHGEIAQILSTTAALATDPDTLGRATTEVREDGLSAPAAIWRAFGRSARTLQDAGGLTAERASDVLDVRSRILSELTGTPRPGLPERSAPFVLVARDLAPVDAAGVDPSLCLGILVAEGGPTSHTAILARALGIPAVVGSDRALELADGDRVLLDGESGEVIVDPTEDQANGAGTSPTLRHRSAPLSGEVAPRSGHPIAVLANVGRPGEVEAAQAAGAQGVGLFRTEFLFLDRTQAPSRAEQTEIYTRVLHTFEGSSVVVRTLDSGSDKPLPFLATTEEENPALGVRGLRLAFDDPGTLQDQLRAIADAARAVPATRVKVMAPMVATEQEAAWFAGLAREEGLAEVGVMVETPAAALCSREITSHLDFVSLGTNDLAQYTMAADRLSAPLAHLNDPWQPALLRLVKACVDGAGDTPVGVCGEAAADPYLAQVLVGIGVSSLSMGAAAVPMVGAALQASSEDRCREAARGALGASDAEEARRLALAVLN